MDIQAYISSGIIESYASDLTAEEESREVEALAAQHPAIQDEIAAVRAALETYAQEFARTPPPALKDRIMAALGESHESGESGEESQPYVSGKPQPFISVSESEDEPSYGKKPMAVLPQQPSSSIAPYSSNRFLHWSIAASILLVVSALANIFLYTRLQQTETLLTQANAGQLRLAQEKQTLQNRFSSVMLTASVVSDPEYKVVNLMPLEAGMAAAVVLYWNPQQGNLYIASNKLPPLPEGKRYQLWAIVDSKPVDAGVFEPKQDANLLAMKGMPVTASAFAITMEDAQGSPTPTGKMYVMGKV